MLKVNRNSNILLYKQVYDKLRKDISQKNYKSGELIPSERELSELFNVDRITIRKALEILVEDGLVEKIAGLGTKVKELPLTHMKSSNSNNIIFILPKNKNKIDRIIEPFNSKLFYIIENELKQRGYSLIYTTLGENEDLAKVLNRNNISGIIFVSQINERYYEEVKKSKIPVVLVKNEHKQLPSVMIDNEKSSYGIVKYLIEQGHKKIGIISGISYYKTSKDRLTGYKRVLMDSNIDWSNQVIKEGDWTFGGGYKAMIDILGKEKTVPTAIFAFNDNTAFGAIKAISDTGLSVPEDISVVGFDDIEQCEYMQPRLTTVKVDIDLIGKVACQHLFYEINSKELLDIKTIIPTKLIVRDSVIKV